VLVTIHSGHNIRIPKPAASIIKPEVFVSLDLDCFKFPTKKIPQDEDIKWEQTFIM
jgi:hypothetical protein